jgi:glucose-6-phosphate 1-dehydrogenase
MLLPAATSGQPGRSPRAIVLFGAISYLTKRPVVPVLYKLPRTKVSSRKFALIGVVGAEATAQTAVSE